MAIPKSDPSDERRYGGVLRSIRLYTLPPPSLSTQLAVFTILLLSLFYSSETRRARHPGHDPASVTRVSYHLRGSCTQIRHGAQQLIVMTPDPSNAAQEISDGLVAIGVDVDLLLIFGQLGMPEVDEQDDPVLVGLLLHLVLP